MDMLWNWVYSMNSACSDPYCAAVTQMTLTNYSGCTAGEAVTLMKCTMGVLQCYMYSLGPIPFGGRRVLSLSNLNIIWL